MKLVCDWLVLCEQVLQDRSTGNLTLINCVDQVNAVEFPANHPRFAFAARFRCQGDPPTEEHSTAYRFVRFSDTDDEEEVATLEGLWRPGTRRSRVFLNFGVLRLRRPERIWFRLDVKTNEGDWQEGPAVPVDVAKFELTDEQRANLERASLRK
ncbi:MAG: DUF6941 family protein [Myxococcota bacterium]